jgi:hypothetical protein
VAGLIVTSSGMTNGDVADYLATPESVATFIEEYSEGLNDDFAQSAMTEIQDMLDLYSLGALRPAMIAALDQAYLENGNKTPSPIVVARSLAITLQAG